MVCLDRRGWAAAVRPRLELAGADLSMMCLHYGGPNGAETPLYPRDLVQPDGGNR